MIDKNLFLETLHEVAEIAATSSEKIKPEEVHRYFEGMELSEEQEKMVYEYLNLPPEAKAARQPECDKAAEEAQKAMAIANEAKAAAAEAKAEALAEIAAQLQAADAKNQEQFKAILSRLEGVESKLSGLDADQIDKAIQAVEAIQVQLKAFEKYNTLLDQLAAYPALIQDVKDAKANIESLTGRVKAAEDAIKANAEAANKALEDLSKEINGKLSTGINTIAGVIAQRLT